MRVLELFSGIGGLHWALKEAGMDFEIVGAMEINPSVIQTYKHNFPEVNILNRNLESLTSDEVNALNIDAIIMSPPCQPFCRTGLGQGSADARSFPLNHILQLLPDIKFSHIFIENVKGFETSDAHADLIKSLKQCGFLYQEFLLNPVSFGIPNSRLRYYLIGKKESLEWPFTPNPQEILTKLPMTSGIRGIMESQQSIWKLHRLQNQTEYGDIPIDYPLCVGDILEPFENIPQDLILPPATAVKYWEALDSVSISSVQSCCFTKAYFRYLTGTGSILDWTFKFNEKEELVEVADRKLRYFSPREIARLLCYPEEFKFPSNQTLKQRYKGLGNSVNVHVVSLLFELLFTKNKL